MLLSLLIFIMEANIPRYNFSMMYRIFPDIFVFILCFNDNLVYIYVACLNKEISNISTAVLLTPAF